jgi:hypothetical protein
VNDQATEIEVYREPQQTSAVVLWGTDDPVGMVARMSAVADAMADVVRKRGLVQTFTIKGRTREYVNVEGWSLVGAMVGIFPHTREVEEIRLADGSLIGFKASVDLMTRDGGTVGGSTAICTRDEERWAERDWNQIASMAQTRATAKAYRMTLGFVMPMASFEATPAEEMDGIGERHESPRAPQRPAPRQPEAPAERAYDPRPVNGTPQWWPQLLNAAKERGVKNSQIASLVSKDGLSLQAAARAWLNQHGSGDDTAADLEKLLAHAAGL